MKTLEQKYPEAYADLKLRGYENICTLMEVMCKPSEIDRALGYNAAASHWMTRRNPPSWASERKAGDWIAENWDTYYDVPESPLERYSSEAIESQVNQPINYGAALGDALTEYAASCTTITSDVDNDTFIAIIPPEKRIKAIKLMTLLGVELVEV